MTATHCLSLESVTETVPALPVFVTQLSTNLKSSYRARNLIVGIALRLTGEEIETWCVFMCPQTGIRRRECVLTHAHLGADTLRL